MIFAFKRFSFYINFLILAVVVFAGGFSWNQVLASGNASSGDGVAHVGSPRPLSIVIIDHLKVRDNAKEVQEIKKQVDAIISKFRKEVLEKESVLRKEYDELINKKPKSGDNAAYQKKLSDFRVRLSKLQVASRQNKNKIEKAYRKAMDNFSAKFTKIIMDFQKENNIDIMLQRENVLFYRHDLDKTDELIERINKAYEKVDIKIEKEDM